MYNLQQIGQTQMSHLTTFRVMSWWADDEWRYNKKNPSENGIGWIDMRFLPLTQVDNYLLNGL